MLNLETSRRSEVQNNNWSTKTEDKHKLENELDAIKQAFNGFERKRKADNMPKTLDGNETEWKQIQSKCKRLGISSKRSSSSIKWLNYCYPRATPVDHCGHLGVRT